MGGLMILGISIVFTLFFAINPIFAQESVDTSEQITLSGDLQNNPVAQDILKKIEKSKRWITQMEQRNFEAQERQKELEQKELAFFTAKGCEACNNIGYAGQIGIYEIFVISKEVEEAILAGNVAEHEIRKIATEHGTVTMVQDGLLKAIDGITSAEEIFRVTE